MFTKLAAQAVHPMGAAEAMVEKPLAGGSQPEPNRLARCWTAALQRWGNQTTISLTQESSLAKETG